ncbi:MAG: holo-ACP synthase, partial [Planctomycetota bacterium]
MEIVAHGIDLVDCPRIEEMIKRHGKRFVNRIFTAAEQAYAEVNKNRIEKLAGRFAAKEAILKLMGTGWRGKIAWTDIEVINNSSGQPEVTLDGEVEKIADKLGIKHISVSITHTAHAVAEIGAETCLITIGKDTIAKMSCNPAIGGLAKGQIAREIDALGGLMGLAIDATGIQFRLLNRSKGPAVQSPRAQADRRKYQDFMRRALEQTANLTIIEAIATEIITENNKVRAVACKDESVYRTGTVVVTPGTFLGGMMYIGGERWAGGRLAEPPSIELSQSLKRMGLELGRMSTDTTPRLDAGTVDVGKLQVQPGDEPPVPFSFMTEKIDRPQVPCWITYTNEDIHKVLRDNLHRAPLSSGQIKGAAPRYCPSIEGKVVRFTDKKQHRIFLEPEEENIKTIYCNGLFTSMPKDVQEQVLKLLPGTEDARIIHYAYAI